MPGTMEVLGLFEVCTLRLYLSQINCGRYMMKISVGMFSLLLLYSTKFFQKRHLLESLYVYVFIIIVVIAALCQAFRWSDLWGKYKLYNLISSHHLRDFLAS